MKTPINDDNRYLTGNAIYARSNPAVKLLITDYKARIYYCSVVGEVHGKTMPYFEHELMMPGEGSTL